MINQSRSSFRALWLRFIGQNALPLLGVTVIALMINAAIGLTGYLIFPELRTLVETRSLAGFLRAGVGIIEHLGSILGLGLGLAVVNLALLGWLAAVSTRRAPNDSPSVKHRLRRLAEFVGTTLLACLIFLGIAAVGLGFAYGLSRWYFGATMPVALVTLLILGLFGLWFIFLPFVVMRDGLTGSQALSESRRRAGRVFGRLSLLAITLVLAVVLGILELDGLAAWARIGFIVLIVPIAVSGFAALYAETDPGRE